MVRKYISFVLIAFVIVCILTPVASGAKTGDQDTGASGTIIQQTKGYAPEAEICADLISLVIVRKLELMLFKLI